MSLADDAAASGNTARLNSQVDDAARAANQAVSAANIALAEAGTAAKVAGPSAVQALRTAYPQPAIGGQSTPDRSFHAHMQKTIDSLSPQEAPINSTRQADPIGDLIVSLGLEESVAAIARANRRSRTEGEAELLNQLSSNPDLMRQLGARPPNNGRPQSLGNLDLDGGGYSSIEGQAIAEAIQTRQANLSNADIANSLATRSFRAQATGIMNAMIESAHHANQPTETSEKTCNPVFFRIIPCPRGGNNR